MVSLIKSTVELNETEAEYHISKYPDTYMHLSSGRCIFLSEDLNKDNAALINAFLLYYNKEDRKLPILFYINSEGGDAAALMSVYDIMNKISAPITTICIGNAFSAGAFLLSSGNKGSRYIYKHSKVMIHGLQIVWPPLGDNQKESEMYYSFLTSYNNQAMKILAKHTGQNIKKIKEDCKSDLYLDAKDAVKYGLVDYILA